MADLHVKVVLLSTSKPRVEAIRAATRRKGISCTVVTDEQLMAEAISRNPEAGILVIDAEATGDLRNVLENRRSNWPILVLSAKFDSSAWVELFKAGASEVIGDPLHAGKLDAALDSFAGDGRSSREGLGAAVKRWLGMR